MSPVATGSPSIVARASLFEVTVDPETLTWHVTHRPPRTSSVQPPQALTYDLDIEQFLDGDSFDVIGLRVTPAGDFAFEFAHTHPFPAPDLTQPSTGINRADLGYTGRLLILADREHARYFDNSLQLDPSFVVGADGYTSPGDLLFSTGLANDTFPYVLLVDEAKDNRVGVSNGGAPLGDYPLNGAGWQADTLGQSGTGWTGGDFLHGGQQVTNEFVIDKDALTNGPASFAVAFLIKYTDPRGVGGREARLPPLTADPGFFAYRLPFAALDVSKVAVTSPGARIAATLGEGDEVTLSVRDWDAQAIAAADADLSDEADVTLVPPGSAGAPIVVVDAPFLSPDPLPLPLVGSASGVPGDELQYTTTLVNELGTAAVGEYVALACTIDPEDASDDAESYHFGVDPVTILPDATRALAIRTYAAVPVTLFDVAACPITQLHFDFEDENFVAWVPGGLGLPNVDIHGLGSYSFACEIPAAEAVFPGVAGRYLSIVNDYEGSHALCQSSPDYGAQAAYNVIGPPILVPEYCGPAELELIFNGGMFTRSSARFRIYSTIDNGETWSEEFELAANGADQPFLAERILLEDIPSQATLRLRFEFVDPNPLPYTTGLQHLGVFIDAITLRARSEGTLIAQTPDTCSRWMETFAGDTSDWSEFGLPVTDAAVAEGAACGFPGPWGGPLVCDWNEIGTFIGYALTFGGDLGVCRDNPLSITHSSDFNIVSPPLDFGGESDPLEVRFDEIAGAWASYPAWTMTVYAAHSPVPGDPSESNWGEPVIAFEHTPGEQQDTLTHRAPLPLALLGQSPIYLRFRLTTPPDTTGYADCPATPNVCQCAETYTRSDWGFAIDNVRVGNFTACD